MLTLRSIATRKFLSGLTTDNLISRDIKAGHETKVERGDTRSLGENREGRKGREIRVLAARFDSDFFYLASGRN